MKPLSFDLPSLTQEVTTDDAWHHMHEADVMSGVRRGAAANGEETFRIRHICNLLKIPTLLENSYYDWPMKLKRPGPVFDSEMTPMHGSRWKPGTQLPRPDGSACRSIRDKHLKRGEFSDKIAGYICIRNWQLRRIRV